MQQCFLGFCAAERSASFRTLGCSDLTRHQSDRLTFIRICMYASLYMCGHSAWRYCAAERSGSFGALGCSEFRRGQSDKLPSCASACVHQYTCASTQFEECTLQSYYIIIRLLYINSKTKVCDRNSIPRVPCMHEGFPQQVVTSETSSIAGCATRCGRRGGSLFLHLS